MASGQLRRFHRPDPPAFFKVVQRPLDRGMEIPATFVELRADLLDADAVRLIDPAGNAWRVGLSRAADGQTWLGSGMAEFGQFYGVRLYHFIFFRAVGKAQFRITIFDRSTAEIDYPVLGGNGLYRPERPQFYHIVQDSTEQELIIPRTFVQKCAERLEDGVVATLIDPAGTTIRALQQTGVNGEAWLRTGWKDFIKFYSIRREELVLFKPIGYSRYEVTIFDKSATEVNYRVVSNPAIGRNAPRSLTISERVDAFRSEHPFFYSVMTSASICTFVLIPQDYVREQYAGREGYESVLLRLPLPARRLWRVTLTFTGRQKRISAGWRYFARDNELEPGNACVFEWHQEEGAFVVYIYR